MESIAAQVSLYPLRTERLGPVIEVAVDTFQQHGIEVQEGAMSTVIAGAQADVFRALADAFARASANNEVVMVVTISNGCPVAANPA